MSICCISHLCVIIRVRITLIVIGFTISKNVSWKSNPWWKPLATIHVLYLLIVPSGFSLSLNTYLHPIACLWGGNVVKVHVSLYKSDWNSIWMDLDQSGFDIACLVVKGYECTRKGLGFELHVLAFVNMLWLLTSNECDGRGSWNEG